jgi:hypothetical protein
MITAMEIAIQNIDQCLNALDTKDMLINLLEKEKEQIIEANIAGMEFIPVDQNKYQKDAEQYYNETYNQIKR